MPKPRILMPKPRILVTRSPHQASALADLLSARGFEPILIPTIELTCPSSFAPLDAALARLATFHWLLFTSANAVEAFRSRLIVTHKVAQKESVILNGAQPSRTTPTDPPTPSPPDHFYPKLPPQLRIAVIGQATAVALLPLGTKPDLIPSQAVAESFAEALLPFAAQPDGSRTRFLLVRAEAARDHLPDTLRAAGADVTIAPAYRTLIPDGSIAQLKTLLATPSTYPDAITFTSSSTVLNLLTLLNSAHMPLPTSILRASIGPTTSRTLASLGFPPQAEAAEPTVAALVEILVNTFHLN